MFFREELIHIYEHISDEPLKRKIHEKLFINDNLVEDIKNVYSMSNLFHLFFCVFIVTVSFFYSFDKL